jgi:predicted phage terminase large subunit-like protein
MPDVDRLARAAHLVVEQILRESDEFTRRQLLLTLPVVEGILSKSKESPNRAKPLKVPNKDPETSLIEFIRQAWHVLEPATPFVPGWHLDAIAEHLQAVTGGQIQNLLINLPPRHCKSLSVCVFWPMWEWIRFPYRRWLFSAYASSLAVRDSLRCRRLICSPWFQERWRDRFKLAEDQNAKARFDNDKGGHRIATGVGGGATGEGGDRVIVDDPHRISQRQSETVREATLIWWDQTMSTRLNDSRTGARVIIMQRLHEGDLSGHVLKQGGYEHLLLPAEFESDRRCKTEFWTDPRKTDGELLWPARVGPRQIAQFKLRLGPEGYSGQFQQRPAPGDGAIFHKERFRYYRKIAQPGLPEEYELFFANGISRRVPVESCRRFATMDPAGSEKTAGNDPCYTVIQIWDLTDKRELVLVDQYREQVSIPTATDMAQELYRQFRLGYLFVERNGLGLGIYQTLRDRGLTIKSARAVGDKVERCQTAEIRMAAQQIFFPREAPYLFAFEKELLLFPRGQHSDQVDALAYAAMRAGALKDEEEEEKKKAVEGTTEEEEEWEHASASIVILR